MPNNIREETEPWRKIFYTHMHINAISANRRQTGFIYRLYGDLKHIYLVTFTIVKNALLNAYGAIKCVQYYL